VNVLVCIMLGSYRGLSLAHILWAVLKSFIFSYVVGIFLLNVAVRIFGRIIGIRKVYRVGVLRYFVVLGCLSVAMGSVLVSSEQPDYPAIQTPELLNLQTEQWQPVKDAKAYCAKQGKMMLLQKIDKADFSVTFICI
jgi:hypothetical protein